jgi:hypothetical protein
MKLPTILAGPIVRRVEPSQAFIWIALSKPFQLDAKLYRVERYSERGSLEYKQLDTFTDTQIVKVGEQLYITLIKITPKQENFPLNTLIGYNLIFENKTEKHDLGSFDLLSSENKESIVYGDLLYPTFYINEKGNANVLYGSCRKPHGEGEDVLAEADKLLGKAYCDVTKRPTSLYLMGDQIYADDVADPLFPVISRLGKALVGKEEDLGLMEQRLNESPFQQNITKINGRQYITENFCQFTSRKATNHLLTLGDYTSMYLLTWSPELWRSAHNEGLLLSFTDAVKKEEIYFTFENDDQKRKGEFQELQERYQTQWKNIANFEESLYSVRRLLANTPTYMMFDDHDITDDWNITREWKTNVWNAPLGRHVISNGLAAYWLFQGWGNNPEQFDDDILGTVQEYFNSLQLNTVEHENWMEQLWNFDAWSFIAPSSPKAIFLDTRTQRDYEDELKPVRFLGIVEEFQPAARLINEQEWDRLSFLLENANWEHGEPLIIVSPTPLYGIGLIESFLHKYILPLQAIGIPVQSMFDLEAWKYNEKGFSEFIHQVARWNPRHCFILSGDIHSASAVKSAITFSKGDELTLHQFTSSPMKNISYTGIWGGFMKFLIGFNVRKRINRTIYRYCNENFNLVKEEDKTRIPRDYIWKESIRYLHINDESIIETDNNIGLLTYTTNEVGNTLLTRNETSNYSWRGKL